MNHVFYISVMCGAGGAVPRGADVDADWGEAGVAGGASQQQDGRRREAVLRHTGAHGASPGLRSKLIRLSGDCKQDCRRGGAAAAAQLPRRDVVCKSAGPRESVNRPRLSVCLSICLSVCLSVGGTSADALAYVPAAPTAPVGRGALL
jgi:hypothetical protein